MEELCVHTSETVDSHRVLAQDVPGLQEDSNRLDLIVAAQQIIRKG